MTMPHLMNCDHSYDGWCLACVKAMHDEYEAQLDELRGLFGYPTPEAATKAWREMNEENPAKTRRPSRGGKTQKGGE